VLLLIGGFEWFTLGGWAMWPLLLISIFSLFVIIERAAYFGTHLKRLDRDLDSVLRGGALLPERLEGELPPLLARGLKEGRINQGRAELAIEHELLRGARLVNSLDTVSQVGPMLGLLGTVTGMVRVFQTVAALQGAANPSDLAGGIWEALLTTVFGLLVGIPAFIAYRFFRSRLLHWESHLRTVVDDVQEVLAEEQARGSRPAPRAEVLR
jgi:biopolymer transport protein ExbB